MSNPDCISKAIIIGAGRGIRLNPLTIEVPKCLLANIGGARMIDWPLTSLSSCGITDIIFIGGHQIKKVRDQYPNFRYYHNANWSINNILESLMCAESELSAGAIVTYSDIVYTGSTVESLLSAEGDITLVVDRDWRRAYVGRTMHPEAEAEKVSLTDGHISQIGKQILLDETQGEFIGLAKFSKRGARTFISSYRKACETVGNKSFHSSSCIQKAYLTDMIQELIDAGTSIGYVDVSGDWAEIDTPQDLLRVRQSWQHKLPSSQQS